MATPASGAIARCWPWPLAPVTCCSATASRTLFSSFSKPNSGQISSGVPGSRKARTNSP